MFYQTPCPGAVHQSYQKGPVVGAVGLLQADGFERGDDAGLVEAQQHVHVLLGQGADVVERVLLADLGHPV